MSAVVGADGTWNYPVTPLVAGEVLTATQTANSQTSNVSTPVTVQAGQPATSGDLALLL